jgi:hypothetical protein
MYQLPLQFPQTPIATILAFPFLMDEPADGERAGNSINLARTEKMRNVSTIQGRRYFMREARDTPAASGGFWSLMSS